MGLLPSLFRIIANAQALLENGALNELQCRNLLRNFSEGLNKIEGIIGDSYSNVFNKAMIYLFEVVCKVEALVMDCCQKAWLQAAVMQIGNKEAFVELLKELDFCFDAMCNISQNCNSDQSGAVEEVRRCTTFIPASPDEVQYDLESMAQKFSLVVKGGNDVKPEDVKLALHLRKRIRTNPMDENVFLFESLYHLYWSERPRIYTRDNTAEWFGVKAMTMQFSSILDDSILSRNVEVLTGLNHPNIIKLFSHEEIKHQRHKLVMERGEMTLSELINKLDPLPEPTAMNIMLQIASVMCYIHARHVDHLELTADNVFVNFPNHVVNELVYPEILYRQHLHVKLFTLTTLNNSHRFFSSVGMEDDVCRFGELCRNIVSRTRFLRYMSIEQRMTVLTQKPSFTTCSEGLSQLIEECDMWGLCPSFFQIHSKMITLIKIMLQAPSADEDFQFEKRSIQLNTSEIQQPAAISIRNLPYGIYPGMIEFYLSTLMKNEICNISYEAPEQARYEIGGSAELTGNINKLITLKRSLQCAVSPTEGAILEYDKSMLAEERLDSGQEKIGLVVATTENLTGPNYFHDRICEFKLIHQLHFIPGSHASTSNDCVQKLLNRMSSLLHVCGLYIQEKGFVTLCHVLKVEGEEMKMLFGRGRLTAALFRDAFFQHISTLPDGSSSFSERLPYLLNQAADLVVKDLPYASKDVLVRGGYAFQLCDEVYDGDLVDLDVVYSLGALVAVCQKFSEVEEADIVCGVEFCIVYHDLSRTYLRRRVKTKVIDERLIENSAGILGVEVTDKEIHVDIVRGDGSYYSGSLQDFAYLLENSPEDEPVDKQCASKIFGHLEGAKFLTAKKYGLKCSPLLAISLMVAIRRENLALKWNETHGHMEAKYSDYVGFEALSWQILYTDKIRELGLAVEWGVDAMPSDKVGSAAGSSRPRLTMQETTSIAAATYQNRKNYSGQVTVGGTGIKIGADLEGEHSKKIRKEVEPMLMENLRKEQGKFVEKPPADGKSVNIKNELLQGRLAENIHNYLIVWDDASNDHVSVYRVCEDGKLKFERDILHVFLKRRCADLLKGLCMQVKRNGTTFMHMPPRDKTGLMRRFTRSAFKPEDFDSSMYKLLILESGDEWEHLTGRLDKYAGNNYLWEATYMKAIVYSRTIYTSGGMLKTYTQSKPIGMVGRCSRIERDDLFHDCSEVNVRGKFSKAPASLNADMIKWGGVKELHIS